MNERELNEALDAYGAPSGATIHERLRGWEQRERVYRAAWITVVETVEEWDAQVKQLPRRLRSQDTR